MMLNNKFLVEFITPEKKSLIVMTDEKPDRSKAIISKAPEKLYINGNTYDSPLKRGDVVMLDSMARFIILPDNQAIVDFSNIIMKME